MGQKLELVVYGDRSDPATAARLYEHLINRDKVDLVLGPYSAFIADAVADLTERHKMPLAAPVAAATPIYRKGRRFLFSMFPPGEFQLEGLFDNMVWPVTLAIKSKSASETTARPLSSAAASHRGRTPRPGAGSPTG